MYFLPFIYCYLLNWFIDVQINKTSLSYLSIPYILDTITGFALDIFKMESWNHIGHIRNMIIKDIVNIILVPTNQIYVTKNAYFCMNDPAMTIKAHKDQKLLEFPF